MHSSIGQNIKSFAVSDARCPMSHTLLCVRARPLISRSQFLTDFDEIWHRRLEPKSHIIPEKNSRKGGVVRVTWPLILWALNANSSKMAKDAKLKFGTHDPRQSPDMTPEKNSRKWGGFRVTWSLIFSALNANSSKISKDVNFKFGTYDPSKVPTWPPEKNSQKGVGVRVTWPLILWALNANSS